MTGLDSGRHRLRVGVVGLDLATRAFQLPLMSNYCIGGYFLAYYMDLLTVHSTKLIL